jgi:hypothetical protein
MILIPSKAAMRFMQIAKRSAALVNHATKRQEQVIGRLLAVQVSRVTKPEDRKCIRVC